MIAPKPPHERPAATERPRALVIGLDALDHERLGRLLAAGALPNLVRFREGVASGVVHSEGGVLGGAVWPTFNAGQGPGGHGRYYSVQWSAGEMSHVRTERPEFSYEPFWSHLAAAGRNTIIFDVPYAPTVDSPHVRTCLGWGMHDEVDPASIPVTFRKTLERRYGRSKLCFDTMEPQSIADRRRMATELQDSAQRRARILLDLAGDPWWDLLLLNFSELHKAGHYLSGPEPLGPDADPDQAFASLLATFDALLPPIVERAGPTALILVLALHGTAHQVDYSGFGPALAALFEGRAPEDPEIRRDLLRRVRDMIPAPLHRAIWRQLPGRIRAARTSQRLLATSDLQTDRLLPLVHDHNAALRLNIRGRERPGVVDPGEAPAVLDEFEKLATGFQADDGLPAFLRMARPQEEYPGPRANRLPDALLIANPEIASTRKLIAPEGQELTSTRPEVRNGIHTSQGFFFARIPTGYECAAQEVQSLDFAPTLLDWFGLEPAPGLEGRPFIRAVRS